MVGLVYTITNDTYTHLAFMLCIWGINNFNSLSKGLEVKATTLSTANAIEKTKKYHKSSFSWQQLTDSVTYMYQTCKDMMLYTVEKDGFHKMLQVNDSTCIVYICTLEYCE